MDKFETLDVATDQSNKRFAIKRWHILLFLFLVILLIALGFHGYRYFSSNPHQSVDSLAKPTRFTSSVPAINKVVFPFASLQNLRIVGVLSFAKAHWAYVKNEQGEVTQIQEGDRLTSQQLVVKKIAYTQVELLNPASQQLTKWGVG